MAVSLLSISVSNQYSGYLSFGSHGLCISKNVLSGQKPKNFYSIGLDNKEKVVSYRIRSPEEG